MPKINVIYENCVMYKIVCKDLNITDCYIGHTTSFTKRKYSHKTDCSNINSKKYHFKVYDVIRKNGGWINWTMIEIEKYPCKDGNEARARERYWIEQLNGTLNKIIPTRKRIKYQQTEERKQKNKNYYEMHINEKKEYDTIYRLNNKEKKKELDRLYREKHHNKLFNHNDCECGGHYVEKMKYRHLKSKKHIEYDNKKLADNDVKSKL